MSNQLFGFLNASNNSYKQHMESAGHTPFVMFAIEIAEKWHEVVTRPVAGDAAPFALMSSGLCNWMASVQLALSGEFFPVPPLCRATIEAALYAHVVAQNNKNLARWSTPPKDHRDKITAKEGIRALRALDWQDAEELEKEYEEFIAFGAHPNLKGIARQLSAQESSGITDMELSAVERPSGKTILPISMALSAGIRACQIHATTIGDVDFAAWASGTRTRLLQHLDDTFNAAMRGEANSGWGPAKR